ncbi:MAG: hypothetical protein IPK74_08595 [Deltaproteobacteria bacterium]|nr:hypothetical protein [Deltaproteobacteria bacterium]
MDKLSWVIWVCLCVGCGGPASLVGASADSTGVVETTGPASTGPDVPASTGDAPCYPGYEGCACTPEGACLQGLQCLSDLCVELSEGSSSTTVVDDTTTGTAGDSSSSGASESSSSTGPEPCNADPPQCEAGGSTLRTCVDGSWVESDCEDECAPMAYGAGTCDAMTAQSCACSEPTDDACWLSAEALCVCYQQYGSVCGTSERDAFYASCVSGKDPTIACFGDHVVNGIVDCPTAIDDCL